MHTSKVLLIVQCMKDLTGVTQIHLSSSMVLLSVESAATTTSTGVNSSSAFANLFFPLKNWHRAAQSKQRGSTIKFNSGMGDSISSLISHQSDRIELSRI